MTQNPGDGTGPHQVPSNYIQTSDINMAYQPSGDSNAQQAPNGVNGANAQLNSYAKQEKPINEAVHHAFDDAHVSGIDQDVLIARITEQVLKQLHPPSNAFAAQQFYQAPPTPIVPISPTASSATSPPPAPRNLYTPPSPHKTTDFTAEHPDSRRSSSERHFSPPGSPHASHTRSAPAADSVRPAPVSRPSLSEETTLEKIWGKLFDAEGKSTPKLGQLLRGTATHMIECYEPKHSLVVTPNKMQRFYKDHPIGHEPYQWDAIFDDDESCISRMYRQLGCEHHLIQEPGMLNEKPDIPGLTPRGFQHWATLLILAHPEEALQRFQNVVLGLPISNPDDRTERFPKELPRKLFPKEGDLRIRTQLVQAIEEHARVQVRYPSPSDTPRGQPPNTMAPPRIPSPPRSEASVASDAHSMGSSIERERKPYGGNIPRDCAIDDTNPPPSTAQSNPIERERKPYAAAPGGGRTFEDSRRPYSPTHDGSRPFEEEGTLPPPQMNIPPAPKSASNPPPPPPPSIQRANSTASSSRPINIPPPPTGRGKDYPPSAYSPNPSAPHRASVSRRRNYSPPPAAGFRSSEGDVTGSFQPSSYENRRMPAFVDSHDDPSRHYPRDMRDSESRRADYARGPSPGRRFERTGTAPHDAEIRRPSSYIAEDYYPRPRRETTGSRSQW